MDVGFANPLGTLQMVSILSCMRSMSDFLCTENFLQKDDRNKPISTVNAMYHYLLDKNDHLQLDLNQRKLHLAEKVGDSCQLNGAKDPHLINKMLNNVVEFAVFDKYGSIDAFIAHSFMSSSDYSTPLEQQIKETLKKMQFLNENGESSTLDSLAVDQIFQDLIKPSLPPRFGAPLLGRGKVRTRRSPLLRKLMPRGKLLEEAVSTALHNSKLPEPKIRSELKKYAFVEPQKTEVNFVKEWMTSKFLKPPQDFEPLKVEDADVFYELKYSNVMDKSDMTLDAAMHKIDALYPVQSHPEIRKKLPVKEVLNDFKKLGAFKEMRFEDYYALRWYGDDGYKKMGGTSDEERRMKNAIYRLALRQFDTPGEIFAENLFRGESRVSDDIERELSSPTKEFQFTRFTSSSTDKNMAIEYSMNTSPGQTRVLYEINFPEPIIRARANHLLIKDENETILLPGTKFHIVSVEDVTNKNCPASKSGVKPKKCIIVKITAMDNTKTIVERQNSIMGEISKLQKTGTKFYIDENSKSN